MTLRRSTMLIAAKIEAAEEGGYFARAVGHPIFTQGETLGEVKKNIEEAVRCHFGRGVPSTLKTGRLDVLIKQMTDVVDRRKREFVRLLDELALDEKKTTTEDPKP